MKMKFVKFMSAFVFLISDRCRGVTALKPTIIPAKPAITIQEGNELRLECQGEGRLRFFTQNNTAMIKNSEHSILKDENSGSYIFIINRTKKEDTGWYACAEEGVDVRNDEQTIDHQSDDTAWIYIYVNSSELLAFANRRENIVIKAGDTFVVPCRPTSPDIKVDLDPTGGLDVLEQKNMRYNSTIGFILEEVDINLSEQMFACVVKEPHSERSYYTLYVEDPAPLELRINKSETHDVVREEDLVVDCELEVQRYLRVKMSWKIPESVPKERWKATEPTRVRMTQAGKVTWKTTLTIEKFETIFEGEYYCNADTNWRHTDSLVKIRSWAPNNTYINVTVDGSNRISANETAWAGWRILIYAYPEDFTLNWLKPNGQEITTEDSNDKTKYSHDSVGLWHFFNISKLTVEDNGNYTLKLFNGVHTKIETLQLTVRAKPSVLIDDVQPFYSPGQPTTITCQSTGQPVPNITWIIKEYPDVTSKENCEVKYPSNVTTKQGPEGSYQSVSRLNVKINQTGEVTCRSCNEIKCVDSTEEIFVSDVPGYFANIDPGLVTEGDNIHVTCGASVDNFTDTITWIPEERLKNQEFNTSRVYLTSQRTNFTWQSILEIHNVSRSDSGKYICEAKSQEGVSEKLDFQLMVQDPLAPRFNYTNLIDSTISIKDLEKDVNKEFVCLVEGRPVPEVIWYKDEERLEENNRFKFSDDNSTLLVTHFLPEDSGIYSCRAKNRVGADERYVDIKIIGKSASYTLWLIIISILILIIVIVIIRLCIKQRQEWKLRRDLLERGLGYFKEGALERLNPDLTVDDQAELLPYDKKWEFPPENLKLGKQLGSGAFGVVMKAEARGICVKGEVTTVAVKMVRKPAEPSNMEALSRELKIMIHLGRHLNVVNLLGACTKTIFTTRELYVIVEYCRFGNLHTYLQSHRSSFINQIDYLTGKISVSNQDSLIYPALSLSSSIDLSVKSFDNNNGRTDHGYVQHAAVADIAMMPVDCVDDNDSVQLGCGSNYQGDYEKHVSSLIRTQDLLCWAWQVSCGMEYLSSRNVLHGDLAARNILLTDDNVVKICDFGLAKNMYKNNNYKKKGDSPLPIKWMAIESISDLKFSIQSDVWSFGIVLWEFLTLARTPYPGIEADQLCNRLIDGYRLEKPEYATNEIYEIMLHCWKADPSERPSFPWIVQKLGALINDSVRTHYTDMNTHYMKMNAEALENGKIDYLKLMCPPNHVNPNPSHHEFELRPYSNKSVEIVDSDSGDCSESVVMLEAENPDFRFERSDSLERSDDEIQIEGDSGYCSVAMISASPNSGNQLSESLTYVPRNSNKNVASAAIGNRSNYIALPVQESDGRNYAASEFSNPHYVRHHVHLCKNEETLSLS